MSSIVAPKLEKGEPVFVEKINQEEDIEERRIKEAREALERRKAEILKRMMGTFDDDEEEDDEDEDFENDDNEFLDNEIEDVVDCIRALTDNELDLLEAAIKNGSISENWLRSYADFDEEEPMDIINRFLKLGIVNKMSSNNYIIPFSLELFKVARKKL